MCSVKKRGSYRLLNMTTYQFQRYKMFKLQHQFNNIISTTQLTNDQMPEFYSIAERPDVLGQCGVS